MHDLSEHSALNSTSTYSRQGGFGIRATHWALNRANIEGVGIFKHFTVRSDSKLFLIYICSPINYSAVKIRAVQLIACDSHAHLVSKAGSG